MGQKVQEAGCWAHARRKFFELHVANKSQIAEQALAFIGQLYEIERIVAGASEQERLRIRQTQSRPVMVTLQRWLQEHRAKVPKPKQATFRFPTEPLETLTDRLRNLITSPTLRSQGSWVRSPPAAPIELGQGT
jgi:hypothetical protein